MPRVLRKPKPSRRRRRPRRRWARPPYWRCTSTPEVVKNAAAPLAQTDKIVMYGDGNSTKLVKDVMSSASQIMDGMKESTGLDLGALLAGVVGGSMASRPSVVVTPPPAPETPKAPEMPEEPEAPQAQAAGPQPEDTQV